MYKKMLSIYTHTQMYTYSQNMNERALRTVIQHHWATQWVTSWLTFPQTIYLCHMAPSLFPSPSSSCLFTRVYAFCLG